MTTADRNPADDHPVRLVARHLLATHLSVFIWFWVVIQLTWGGIVTALALFSDVRTSVWEWLSLTPPKYFLLVLSIIALVALPTYIAHGITRRHYGLAWLALIGCVALVYATLGLASYGIEYLALSATGLLPDLTTPLPVGSVGDGLATLGRALVVLLAWACSGWLAGLGFYRFGAWRGVLFTPVAGLPLVVVESTFFADRLGINLAITGPVAVAAGLMGAFLLTRDVPVRKVSG